MSRGEELKERRTMRNAGGVGVLGEDGSTCCSRSRAVLADRSQRGRRSHSHKAVEEERQRLGLQ